MYLTGCNFSKNSAENDGAVSNMRRCYLILKDCCFENNDAMENGGALHNWMGFIDMLLVWEHLTSNFCSLHMKQISLKVVDNLKCVMPMPTWSYSKSYLVLKYYSNLVISFLFLKNI